jgi:hypothetical protein
MTSLLKLARIGSAAILTPPLPSEAAGLADHGRLGTELFEWLRQKNGSYAFESALHIFPIGQKGSVMDLTSWNSPDLWRGAYGDLTNRHVFFGEDIFGNQFCLMHDSVGRFDAETGEVIQLAGTLEDWAKLVLSEYELHTGCRLANKWQSRYRMLNFGERLLPKMPFVTGGTYTVENLYAIDSVRGMRLRGDLALQIRHLPDGTPIRYKIV